MVSRWAAYIVELWACVAKFIQATRLQSLVQIKSVYPQPLADVPTISLRA